MEHLKGLTGVGLVFSTRLAQVVSVLAPDERAALVALLRKLGKAAQGELDDLDAN